MDIFKKKNFIYFIPIFLIFSYFTGFILNENSSVGAYNDFLIHLNTSQGVKNGILDFLLKYDEYGNAHSPVFIIILELVNIGENTFIARLFSLIVSLLIPIIFLKCVELKYNLNDKFFLVYLSCFFFISPYFRSLAFWPGSENLSIILFLAAIFYFLKFNKSINNNNEIKYIFLNVFFLALASYIRPIYCIFSLFFFYEIILKNYTHKKLIYYFIFNLLLSLPAIYYVFILEIYFFDILINSNTNFITKAGFTYTVVFFYLTPFIFFYKNLYFEKYKLITFLSLILFIIFILFFKYETSTGGGFYYNLFVRYFENATLFFIFSLISIICVNLFLNLKIKSNLILFFILFLLEADSQFYQETFDPILFIMFFTMFELKFINKLINSKNFKKINFIFLYLLTFYFISLYKSLFLV